MKKLFLILLVAVAGLVLLGGLLKDVLAKKLIVGLANGVGKAAGGFEVAIDRLHFGIISPTIEVLGVKILNPTNYPVRECLELNRLFIRRAALWGGAAEIPELDLDLKRIVLIRRSGGEMNLEKLASAQSELMPVESAGSPPVASAPSSPAPAATTGPSVSSAPDRGREVAIPFSIGKLRIKIDQLDYYDYSLGSEPMVIPATLNFDQTFLNVTNIEDIATQLQSQLMFGELLGGRTNGLLRPRKLNDAKADQAVDEQIENVIKGL